MQMPAEVEDEAQGGSQPLGRNLLAGTGSELPAKWGWLNGKHLHQVGPAHWQQSKPVSGDITAKPRAVSVNPEEHEMGNIHSMGLTEAHQLARAIHRAKQESCGKKPGDMIWAVPSEQNGLWGSISFHQTGGLWHWGLRETHCQARWVKDHGSRHGACREGADELLECKPHRVHMFCSPTAWETGRVLDKESESRGLNSISALNHMTWDWHSTWSWGSIPSCHPELQVLPKPNSRPTETGMPQMLTALPNAIILIWGPCQINHLRKSCSFFLMQVPPPASQSIFLRILSDGLNYSSSPKARTPASRPVSPPWAL